MFLKNPLERFKADPPRREAYRRIVVQARQPAFYASLGVPDTVNGRFDMICLHAFLLFERMRREEDEEAARFAQEVFDEMFMDMDANLREMGVSDLAVGGKVRRLAEVFYGRTQAYMEALRADDETALRDAFRRNVFESAPRPGAVEALHEYFLAAREELKDQSAEELRAGRVRFPPPPEPAES